MSTLELGVIGNCSFGALVDPQGRIVWACLPRFDGDPVFCSLLDGARDTADGQFAIELEEFDRAEQSYIQNTAVLTTRLYDHGGNAIEITDFAPRFRTRGRGFRPTTLVRRVRALVGTPRIRACLAPRFDYGATVPSITHGSNHIRYVGPDLTLRLSTNAPISYVLNQTWFLLERPVSFILGPDETLTAGVERHRARVRGTHGRGLAAVGSALGRAPRVARRGDPRRDHIEAVRVRRNGCDRCRDDH